MSNEAIIQGVAKAIWQATHGTPWKDASGMSRQDTLRQAKAAIAVFDPPLHFAQRISEFAAVAADLSKAVFADGKHVPKPNAACPVCAKLGETFLAWQDISPVLEEMKAAREKMEKDAKQ